RNNFYQGNASGSIAFKNINDPENSTHVSEGRPFIHGWGVQLDFSGCTFGKINLANAWRDSTIRFRDSSLRGSSIWTGETSVSFEKCTFSGDTTLDVNGKVELINCTAPSGVLKGHQTELNVKGGNVVMNQDTSS
ncbi:hypothetical protein LJC48_05630, partial [Desulfovibrio sp. OttesenSCG-928-C06]|nr:hypothetical protein [Desulfovibrio sp. OttesenSCG-928-C06]